MFLGPLLSQAGLVLISELPNKSLSFTRDATLITLSTSLEKKIKLLSNRVVSHGVWNKRPDPPPLEPEPSLNFCFFHFQFWFHQIVYLFSDHLSAFRVILLSRVFLGACQGVHFPAMASISSRNLSTKDRSFFFSFTSAGKLKLELSKYQGKCK